MKEYKSMYASWSAFSITFLFGIVCVFFTQAYSGNAQTLFEDFDRDGLSNEEEKVLGTDPYSEDSDGDGYGDYVEVSGGYDPLKKAPGDKLVEEPSKQGVPPSGVLEGEEGSLEEGEEINATQKAAAQLAVMAEDATEEGEEITLDNIQALVNDALAEANEPMELPEINREDINILEQDYDDLDEEERKEREREDSVQYLSSVAYIIATASPKGSDFTSQDAFGDMIVQEFSQMISGFTLGQYNYVERWSESGRKILSLMEDVEVPENMLDLHTRGLQFASYAVSLEEISKPDTDDPIGNIAILSKAQGLLDLATDFQTDLFAELENLGIEEIPLDISKDEE